MKVEKILNCVVCKSNPKNGISLIVLMITIVVMIILASAVIISSIGSIDNARLTSFAHDVNELEDSAEGYFLNNKTIPYPEETSNPLTISQILEISGVENEQDLQEELELNSDNSNTQFYYLDMKKIDVQRISNGLKESGENDVYVIAYPSMNIYYLKGIIVNGVKYFSISSKMPTVQNIEGEEQEDDDSSTNVEIHDDINVTKASGWTNTMPVTVKTSINSGEKLYISILGIEKQTNTSVGIYTKTFNVSDLFTTNDILMGDTFASQLDSFNIQSQLNKNIEFVKKDINGNTIGRNIVELSNFEMETPQITELSNNSYTNMNITSFKVVDNVSKIKEVKYDYLTQINEDGTEVNYYQGTSEFNIEYLKENGKIPKIGANGEINIQLNKNIRKLVVGVIDNAGNWTVQTITFDNMFYIGSVINSASKNSIKITANVYSTYGLSQLKFFISTDANNYTGEQAFTYNTVNTNITQQVEYTGVNYSKAYIKIEATDNNENAPSRKTINKIVTIGLGGSGNGEEGIELQNPEIVVSPTTVTNEVTVTIDYFNAPIKEYAITTDITATPTMWQSYGEPFTLRANGCIWARAKNNSESEKISTKEVNNIDSVPPTITISDNGVTTSSISVKAVATDTGGSGLNDASYQYSKDNGSTWTEPTNQTIYTFTNLTTGTYICKARVKDNAGNISSSNSLDITTLGMSTITMGASPTGWTNGNVTVNISYPAELVTREYRIGSAGAWTTYAGPITMTENDTVYARGNDAAGNQAAQSTITITNIDKTLPSNATINVYASGSNVTGTLTLADTGGSGINVTSSKYLVTTTSTAYAVDNSIWNTADAKSISTNPKSISEARADANYYVQVLSVDKAGNKRVNVSSVVTIKVKIGNPPVLTAGMTPIKWDGSGNVVATSTMDIDWYDYSQQRWANARTADGSMWVWIPRYEYRITTPHTSTTQVIAINFLNGTSTTATSGYIVHPAFTFGGVQLTGIWVAKFEASGNTVAVDIKPGISSLRSITLDSAFIACRNIEFNSRYGWGTSGTGIDTHLMKNIEWGVVAYLSDSQYGKNGTEVAQNTNTSYYTGGGTGTSYITNVAQSTTGNIYGIYDMSGGTSEFVSAYQQGASGSNYTNILAADVRYKDVFVGTTSTTTTDAYGSRSGVYGEAIWETSTTVRYDYRYYDGDYYQNYGSLTTSWFGDTSDMSGRYIKYSNPAETSSSEADSTYYFDTSIIRGTNGIFAFTSDTGGLSSTIGFRPTIAVASGL